MELELNELQRLREEAKRWDAYRSEMADLERRFAKLANNFLELGDYENAAKCAMKADSMKWVCGRIPPDSGQIPRLDFLGLNACQCSTEEQKRLCKKKGLCQQTEAQSQKGKG